ncbi:uncharacterized protein G2W53_042062 [Senna tora]|uniref:Uncharacterized protein n=1 Tax=Senna tora TaxID=362788 RepID=A0A834SG81_9FABA|nr:uncharacterized protein G2W53_042062 [Senna tora]
MANGWVLMGKLRFLLESFSTKMKGLELPMTAVAKAMGKEEEGVGVER